MDVRAKIQQALELAADHDISTPAARNHLIDHVLPFWARATYGGNTPCVQVIGSECTGDVQEYIVCDAGSGLRNFGDALAKAEDERNYRSMDAVTPERRLLQARFHVLLSHLHYDHLQGFPFFKQAWNRGCEIHFYGCHADLEEALRRHQQQPFFPVQFDRLGASIHFHQLQEGKPLTLAGVTVYPFKQDHPGDSYGYRFMHNGRTFVYSTDSEHREDADGEEYSFLRHLQNADVVIFDAQYQLREAIYTKENWGHSNNFIGVELAVRAHVGHLVLFHHDPVSSDQALDELQQATQSYADMCSPLDKLRVSIAHDGMEIEV
ncbi:MAG: MBL fold metallo-hydrolase [Candidatus Methylacidiphilales bacterium]